MPSSLNLGVLARTNPSRTLKPEQRESPENQCPTNQHEQIVFTKKNSTQNQEFLSTTPRYDNLHTQKGHIHSHLCPIQSRTAEQRSTLYRQHCNWEGCKDGGYRKCRGCTRRYCERHIGEHLAACPFK